MLHFCMFSTYRGYQSEVLQWRIWFYGGKFGAVNMLNHPLATLARTLMQVSQSFASLLWAITHSTPNVDFTMESAQGDKWQENSRN